MTQESPRSIEWLRTKLLNELQAHNYAPSTIQAYKETLNRLEKFMLSTDIAEYAPAVGLKFLEYIFQKRNYSDSRKRQFRIVIRRLNDESDGRYVYSVPQKDLSVPFPFNDVAKKYIDYCRTIGNSPFTVKLKERAIFQFISCLFRIGCTSFNDMNADEVRVASLNVNSVEFYPELRDFLRFLFGCKFTGKDFSTLVPKQHRGFRLPDTFTADEIRMVEQSVNRNKIPGKRDYAVILLASRLGIRSGDIANLKFNNLNFDDGHINFIQQKTGTPCSLLMIPEIKTALIEYIKNERPDSSNEYVFLKSAAPYDRISYSVVSWIVKKYMDISGIDIKGRRRGPHSLRASMATSMVNDGIDYDSVRKVLGHSSENAIKHYAKLDIVMLRKCALKVISPTKSFYDFLEVSK